MSPSRACVRVPVLKQVAVLTAVLGLVINSRAGVVLNEFMAASSERRLVWDAAGVPHLGSGVLWTDLGFEAGSWSNGYLPAGYGFSGLATDLTSQMKDKTPSLYLRKEFQATSAQAVSSNPIVLSVQYNDGFIAYLNGREVARINCGPTNHFLFAGQPAYNLSTTANVVEFTLGPAAAWLLPGRNLLALQAHNAEKPSTTSDPGLITQHQPTPEFRIGAGLKLAGDTTNAPVDFIPWGSSAGPWRYWVGRAEPSGGMVDMGLITKAFNPPAGEEDDYDQPADFADWVELYNDGTATVNLGGWSLTDDLALPGKWRFPTNTLLPAGGYLLVLCDDRDEANAPAGPATRLHTNFKLSDEGEYLGLLDQFGQFVDGLPKGYPSQVAWCSYGRNPTNSAAFGFLSTATPGTNNAGAFYPARVEAPHFQDAVRNDLPGGIYVTQSLALYLRDDVTGSLIRYTLNGSEPTENNGLTYTNPLMLTQSNEKVGVVVRARAFLPGFLPSKVKTHTYLLRQPAALTNAPALLFTADSGRDFYAPEGLMAIVGGQFVSVSSGTIWMANGPQSYNIAVGNGSPFERAT
ncbi:MAG TPA: lamin tail domain-containing protein, partial [Bacillota bacterium]|nr:lamin tail domain-containing protein [Bacillota bacterium]